MVGADGSTTPPIPLDPGILASTLSEAVTRIRALETELTNTKSMLANVSDTATAANTAAANAAAGGF